MQIVNGDKHRTMLASSPRDLLDWASRTPRVWKQESSKAEDRAHSWDFSVGFEGMVELVNKGWQAGAANIVSSLASLPKRERVNTRQWAFVGHTPSIPRYLAGNPRHMERRGYSTRTKPVLEMVISGAANCDVHAQAMAHAGTALASAIDGLETAGQRLGISILFPSRMDIGHTAIPGWRFKRPEQALDLERLAFSVAHPAALRRLAFLGYERTPIAWECSGYGAPQYISREYLKGTDLEDAIILNIGRQIPMDTDWSLEEAVEFVSARIAIALKEATETT